MINDTLDDLEDLKNSAKSENGHTAESGRETVDDELDENLRETRIRELEETLQEYQDEHLKVMIELSERFPDEPFVLPTRFGNILRSFEVYSRLMYGFEDIQGWSRLLTVIPKDYQRLIDDTKAQTDFWLNLWFISLVVILEYVGIAAYAIGSCELFANLSTLPTLTYSETLLVVFTWLNFGVVGFPIVLAHMGLAYAAISCDSFANLIGIPMLFFLIAAFAVALISSWGAKVTAKAWGDYVKASYDIYLPALAEKLGFPPMLREQQKELWTWFSKAIIYRSEANMDDLSYFSHRMTLLRQADKELELSTSEARQSLYTLSVATLAGIAWLRERNRLSEDLKRKDERISLLEEELRQGRRPRRASLKWIFELRNR